MKREGEGRTRGEEQERRGGERKGRRKEGKEKGQEEEAHKPHESNFPLRNLFLIWKRYHMFCVI